MPLTFLREGERLVLVASNGGSDRHPAWWLNLRAEPCATVRVGRDTYDVVAERAEGAERDRLWELLGEYNPFYRSYARVTDRDIPVVVLNSTDGGH